MSQDSNDRMELCILQPLNYIYCFIHSIISYILQMSNLTRNQGFMAHLIYLKSALLIDLKCTEHWGRFCTFEAKSVSNVLCLKCTESVHLRQILYIWGQIGFKCSTFEANSVHLRPILCERGRFSLKCTESASNVQNRPQMFSASNVELLRLILYIWGQMRQILFDVKWGIYCLTSNEAKWGRYCFMSNEVPMRQILFDIKWGDNEQILFDTKWGQMRQILFDIKWGGNEAETVWCQMRQILLDIKWGTNEADTVWHQMRQILFDAKWGQMRHIYCLTSNEAPMRQKLFDIKWGANEADVHLRPILYIWGQIDSVHLNHTWITWEKKLSVPQMLNILYIWGRFCTFEAKSASNLVHWGNLSQSERICLKCSYIWGRFGLKSTESVSMYIHFRQKFQDLALLIAIAQSDSPKQMGSMVLYIWIIYTVPTRFRLVSDRLKIVVRNGARTMWTNH